MFKVDEPTRQEFEALLPCPGCGRKPLLAQNIVGYQFTCDTPGCHKWSPSRQGAVDEWNRRARGVKIP